MKIGVLVFLVGLILFPNRSYSQGCSDGGACSINSVSMSSSSESHMKLDNQITTGMSLGLGVDKVLISTPFLEFSRALTENYGASAKISYGVATGDEGTVTNLGDLFLSVNRNLDLFKDIQTSLTVGGKIPLNKADEEKDGFDFPMVYQSSVGSYDLILGLNAVIDAFSIWLAVQYPLSYSNENSSNEYTPHETDFLEITGLKRTGDILLRLSYQYELIEDVIITPGFLPIYHFANDNYETASGDDIVIENSKGFTFNWTLAINYSFTRNQELALSFASPLIYREVFPAGLKRSFVSGFEYKVRF